MKDSIFVKGAYKNVSLNILWLAVNIPGHPAQVNSINNFFLANISIAVIYEK